VWAKEIEGEVAWIAATHENTDCADNTSRWPGVVCCNDRCLDTAAMMQPSESPCQPLGVVPPTDRDAALSKGDDDVVVVTGDRDHGERKTLTLLSSDDDNTSIPADLLVVAHDQQDTQVCSSPCPAKLIDCSSIWGTRAHKARTQANLVRTTFSLTDGLTSSACVRSCVCACLPACLRVHLAGRCRSCRDARQSWRRASSVATTSLFFTRGSRGDSDGT
jgi:hypothetical protein